MSNRTSTVQIMTMLILVCSCSSSVLAYGWPFPDSCIGEDQLSLLLANWGIGDEWGEGDLDDNGTVNDADLSLLLANWGCPPIMGDVNLNGLVDDDDLSILLAHWNQYDVGWTEGDLNGDGYVDDDDLSLFTAPPWPWPGDPPAPEAIPEPGTVALLAVGGPWYDLNLSGCVDDDDLSLLLVNWNIGTTWGTGDLNNDLTVDDDDLSLLLAHWGQGCPLAPEAIPEPATMALLPVGGLGLIRRRRASWK